MAERKTRTCPLCKKEGLKYLSAHLRDSHKMKSAKERVPYLKNAKDIGVEHKDTMLSSMVDDDSLIQFEEQKRILNVEFQDIEDQIVSFYLMTRPKTRSTKHIREKIQTQLFPLYKMVIESLEAPMFEMIVQLNSDVSPPDAKRMKIFKVSADEQEGMVDETNIEK